MLVVSPVALTPEVHETIRSQGAKVRYIAAPDIEHHLHIGTWKDAFPDAEIIAPEGLYEKRQRSKYRDAPFAHVLTAKNKHSISISEEFDREIDIEYVDGHVSREIVFLHKPSRTVIEADLLFNPPPNEQYSRAEEPATAGFLTRFFSSVVSAKPPAIWQQRFAWYLLAKDRARFAESMRRIYGWDFDRLIPCHGDVIETGAKGVFQSVFGWFLEHKG